MSRGPRRPRYYSNYSGLPGGWVLDWFIGGLVLLVIVGAIYSVVTFVRWLVL